MGKARQDSISNETLSTVSDGSYANSKPTEFVNNEGYNITMRSWESIEKSQEDGNKD